jgi:hypothetical protein
VASSKSGKLLQLGRMGKDVRWQSIQSKEDKGTREVDHRIGVGRRWSGTIPAMRW